MNCLLCQSRINVKQKFTNLLLLNSSEEIICENCHGQFQKIQNPHCPSCYKNMEIEECQDCLYWKSHGKEVNHEALYNYNAAMKEYFSKYKFQGDYLLGKVFAREVRKALTKYKDYSIVPVPLGKKRHSDRKFNQVTAILEAANINYQDILSKEDTEKQSSKSREERLDIKNPFSFKEGISMGDKVLIVDDIYTTGATLQIICQLFRESGIKNVRTFTIAR